MKNNQCSMGRLGNLIPVRVVMIVVLMLGAIGTPGVSAATCERCAVGSIPLPRAIYGSTNFLSAYVSRDFRAGQGGCFYGDGTGMMRRLVWGKRIRFAVTFIPVIDVETITRTGTSHLSISANMSAAGGGAGIESGGSYSVATTRGGMITLSTSTFTAETDGTSRMAGVSSRFCPLIPTTRVWMQGMSSFTEYGSANISTMTQAI